MTKDEAEIRSIIADRAKAHHAKNVDLLLAHGGEGFLSFDLAPPLRNKGGSPKEARREIEAWFAIWKGPIGLEERDLVVTAGDNVAFSTSLTHMTGTKTRRSVALVPQHKRFSQGKRQMEGHARAQFGAFLHGRQLQCPRRPQALMSSGSIALRARRVQSLLLDQGPGGQPRRAHPSQSHARDPDYN
jgi:ketosteroid isomerase-like protein